MRSGRNKRRQEKEVAAEREQGWPTTSPGVCWACKCCHLTRQPTYDSELSFHVCVRESSWSRESQAIYSQRTALFSPFQPAAHLASLKNTSNVSLCALSFPAALRQFTACLFVFSNLVSNTTFKSTLCAYTKCISVTQIAATFLLSSYFFFCPAPFFLGK